MSERQELREAAEAGELHLDREGNFYTVIAFTSKQAIHGNLLGLLDRIDELEGKLDAELKSGSELFENVSGLLDHVDTLTAERDAMREALNTPEIDDFVRGVTLEAQHQRERWPKGHDDGKSPADWFWTLGYLSQKAMTSDQDGNVDKLKHHLITSAALMANWHAVALRRAAKAGGADA